jgi:oxygen-independent coproporphyrinogen-3 oxidase
MSSGIRHVYAHLPFCRHRCGYCDFVTVVGRRHDHGTYVDALLTELRRERHLLASSVETVFVGGGTPTFTDADALARLLAALPRASEVTVEANPETVTPRLASLLRDGGVTRISLGAQSFVPRLLDVLEREASPRDVRCAVHTLRDVGFDNISLDLLYGIPGQEPADLEHDLAEALALRPEHLSWYELEAKPGTRFTHSWAGEVARQAEAMEVYFEQVVDVLTARGYRWYETANFCLDGALAGGRDLRAQHNLGYWRARDYLGVGVGAVSTIGLERRRNASSLTRYISALGRGEEPPREIERLDTDTRARERVMLGLRLDEPLVLEGLTHVLDEQALPRLERHGLLERVEAGEREPALRLSSRGRFVGGGVTAELLVV